MKRESQLDWLRGLAIVLMVINHVSAYLVVRPLPLFAYFSAYLTVSLAGPLFLFISGYVSGLKFNHPRLLVWKNISQVIQRFLLLLASWLAVNLLFYFNEPWYRGRILLLFACCSLLAWPATVLARQQFGKILIFVSALGGILAFPLVLPWLKELPLVWPILGDVFMSEFTLWPWLALFAGGILAQAVLDVPPTSKERREKMFLISGIFLLGAWFILSLVFGRYWLWLYEYDINLNGYWAPSLITWLWIIGWLLLLLPLAKYISFRIFPTLAFLGQKAIWFYFVQFWLIIIIGREMLDLQAYYLLEFFIFNSVIILILCILATSKVFAKLTALSRARPKDKTF